MELASIGAPKNLTGFGVKLAEGQEDQQQKVISKVLDTIDDNPPSLAEGIGGSLDIIA